MIGRIFNQVETLLKAQQEMMAGAREEDRRYMAKLVHKEIVTLHQELSNQNASHDVTMTNTEDDILALEIQALRTTVQALESTMHKQQNTIEQYSQKVELLEDIPRISPLKSTGDDMEIDGVSPTYLLQVLPLSTGSL